MLSYPFFGEKTLIFSKIVAVQRQKNASIFLRSFYNIFFSRRSRVWRHCIRRLRRPTQTLYSPTPHSQIISKKILFYRVSMFYILRRVFAVCMHWQCVKDNSSFSQVFQGCLLVLLFLFQTLVRRIFLLQHVYQASTKLYNNAPAWSKKNSGKSKKTLTTLQGPSYRVKKIDKRGLS